MTAKFPLPKLNRFKLCNVTNATLSMYSGALNCVFSLSTSKEIPQIYYRSLITLLPLSGNALPTAVLRHTLNRSVAYWRSLMINEINGWCSINHYGRTQSEQHCYR
ncbi:hypothetical protein, partial [Burkholderia ubonensis]|uniref:hypothetical protein n=1 Tax=Burkholderia ubonensis TaxID=101571 RepID=UPI001E2F1CC6